MFYEHISVLLRNVVCIIGTMPWWIFKKFWDSHLVVKKYNEISKNANSFWIILPIVMKLVWIHSLSHTEHNDTNYAIVVQIWFCWKPAFSNSPFCAWPSYMLHFFFHITHSWPQDYMVYWNAVSLHLLRHTGISRHQRSSDMWRSQWYYLLKM